MTNLKEIAQKIIDNEIEYFGIRTLSDDENYKVGDECRESYEWNIEHDCSTFDLDGEDGETAGGTCATNVDADCYDDINDIIAALEKAIATNKVYGNARQAVIAGPYTNTNGYFDEDEIRLVDAYVVALI